MKKTDTITINDRVVTFRPLTIREIYALEISPPNDSTLQILYLAFEADCQLILESADCEPELLLDGVESEIQEAFRKANPFVEKPLLLAFREKRNAIFRKAFSDLFVASFSTDTPEPGITQ